VNELAPPTNQYTYVKKNRDELLCSNEMVVTKVPKDWTTFIREQNLMVVDYVTLQKKK